MEEHWFCRRRRAREILRCDKEAFAILDPFLPKLELPTAVLYIVEYLEALMTYAAGRTLTPEVTPFGASVPLFAKTQKARYLMGEAQKLAAALLCRDKLTIEDVSSSLNLSPCEVLSWRKRGLVQQRQGCWMVSRKDLWQVLRWHTVARKS